MRVIACLVLSFIIFGKVTRFVLFFCAGYIECPMSEPIRVFITGDPTLVRSGDQALLETIDDIDVVGDAAGGEQAVAGVAALQPDVVLMDLEMPVIDGAVAGGSYYDAYQLRYR